MSSTADAKYIEEFAFGFGVSKKVATLAAQGRPREAFLQHVDEIGDLQTFEWLGLILFLKGRHEVQQ